MAMLWMFGKGVLSIADVFYTFFTERPLFAAEGAFAHAATVGETRPER